MSKRGFDGIVAAITAFIAVAVLLLIPHQIPGESLGAIGNVGSPAFFPILAACLLFICSVALGLQALADRGDRAGTRIEFQRRPLVFTVMALFVIYAVAAKYLGMISASFLMIVAMAWLLNFRELRIVLPTAVAVPAAIYFLFEKLLLILLPEGALF